MNMDREMAGSTGFQFSMMREQVGKRRQLKMVIADPANNTQHVINFGALRSAGAAFFDNVVDEIVGSESLRRLATKAEPFLPITGEAKRLLISAYATAAAC